MKKVINLMKKATKRYFNQASKSYYLTPTGCVPFRID